MNPIVKTYSDVDHEGGDAPFQIKRMGDVFDMTGGIPDAPHRHNYYTVIVLGSGVGIHRLDFHDYTLGENEVHFISPGQVHQMVEESRPEGYVLTFAERFLVHNDISRDFIERINLFREYGSAPPLQLRAEVFHKIRFYCEEMLRITVADESFGYEAAGAYLKLLLIRCNQACTIQFDGNTQNYHAGLAILSDFRKLVAESFRTEHSVQFYADQLMVTSDHLNRTVRALTGMTAKEYIAKRVLLEAKRVLYFSSLSAKEIGYSLGFVEPSHFSAFFKREAGLSITEFRTENA